jgi:hypothetical protein
MVVEHLDATLKPGENQWGAHELVAVAQWHLSSRPHSLEMVPPHRLHTCRPPSPCPPPCPAPHLPQAQVVEVVHHALPLIHAGAAIDAHRAVPGPQHSTAQHSTAQHSTAQHSTAQHTAHNTAM